MGSIFLGPSGIFPNAGPLYAVDHELIMSKFCSIFNWQANVGKITTASQRNMSVDLMDVADRWVRTVWKREKAAATGQTARWATFEFGAIFEIAIANIQVENLPKLRPIKLGWTIGFEYWWTLQMPIGNHAIIRNRRNPTDCAIMKLRYAITM